MHGPQAYISPTWYEAKARPGRVVPTWNYEAVHLTGTVTGADLLALWGTGPRRFLFVPGDVRAHVAGLLGNRAYLLQELSDKALYTDRPL